MNEQMYYESLPKKRIATGVLFIRDEKILLVKPTYKDYWHVPGGVVELDESPFAAAVRECQEEIGLTPKIDRLICVDFVSKRDEYKGNSLNFIFLAKQLKDHEISLLCPREGELERLDFFNLTEAVEMLSGPLKERITMCLLNIQKRDVIYSENGVPKF